MHEHARWGNFCNKQEFSLSGRLVELPKKEKLNEVQEYLMTHYTNRSFWVGSSDLDEEGTFRWFYSGDEVASDLWSVPAIKGNRCLRFNKFFMKFSARDCDNKAHYICEVSYSQMPNFMFFFSTRQRSTSLLMITL